MIRTMGFTVPGAPMGAVRQSRRDIWKPSPAVQRYRSWRDVVRAAFMSARNKEKNLPPADLAPDELHVVAYMPIPQSWSKKKQAEASGKPHRSVPDIDNIFKACGDAIFEQDSRIHFGSSRKKYDDGRGARLEVIMIWSDDNK